MTYRARKPRNPDKREGSRPEHRLGADRQAARLVCRAAQSARLRIGLIVKLGRSSGDIQADITDRGSIDAMYREAGKVDAGACASDHAHFGPLEETTEEQFMLGLTDKVMGAEGVSCQAYFGPHLSLQRRTLYNQDLPGAPENSDQGTVTIEEPADAVPAFVD